MRTPRTLTPGQRVDAVLGGTSLVRAEAVREVGVGTAAAQETTTEQQLAAIDPAAALALLGYVPGAARATRQQAMRVPGIRRGRNLIAGTIGTLPLSCTRTTSSGTEPVRRTLLQQLDPRTTPAFTLTWTVDDLMFSGVSWWRVTKREAVAGERIGFPLAVERLAPGRVRVDLAEGRVYVDAKPARDADLIRFDGLDQGLLEDGGPVVRLATALMDAGYLTATDEVPSMILRPAEGAPELSPEAAAKLLADWEAARRQRRTAYLNRSVDAEKVAFDARSRQLTELSQLVSSELARLLNLPASRIGAPAGSGMTYTNTEADRRELVELTFAPYLAAVAQRLSMPDVTPAGQVVTFDTGAFVRGTTAELVTAGKAAIDAGLADAEEIRTSWLRLPPRGTSGQLPTADNPS